MLLAKYIRTIKRGEEESLVEFRIETNVLPFIRTVPNPTLDLLIAVENLNLDKEQRDSLLLKVKVYGQMQYGQGFNEGYETAGDEFIDN